MNQIQFTDKKPWKSMEYVYYYKEKKVIDK